MSAVADGAAPVRVLVVDDSALVRRLVCDALNAVTGISVVGTATNGQDALAQIDAVRPDVVTLDIEMPVMDGVTAMGHIRRAHPGLPVIMFSTLTEQGARATFDALAAGAMAYVTKPTNTGGLAASMEMIRTDLGGKVMALAEARRPRTRPVTAGPGAASAPAPRPATPAPERGRAVGPSSTGPVDAVLVGISTGGPNALAALVRALPADLPVPVMVVQHMPPVFTKMLADRLDRESALTVTEAAHGDLLAPGRVYLAPGDYHLSVEPGRSGVRAGLSQDAPVHFCRPAVDVLFRTAAAVYGPRVLAVVMTGMGSDGTDGARALRERGAPVWVQDKATSVVWGMPGSVHGAGLSDKTLPLEQIGPAITARVRAGSRT